jgi:hypothetical protein
MADRNSILKRAGEQVSRYEESVYRSHVALSGNVEYQPASINVFQLKGDREAVQALARSSSFAEIAELVETLVTRLIQLEGEVIKLKSIGGNKKS